MSAIHSDDRLRGLAKHLTYDHFRTLLSAKNSSVVGRLGCFCHFDIIAALPLEIVQKIFLLLPLHQCFKSQRVSRRWHKVLSAPQTMQCLIQWWYPSGETDLCIPDNLSIEATLNLKAEHIDAFRTGHPFSKSSLDDMPHRRKGTVYAHGMLAWINLEPSEHIGRSIEILELRTHLRRHLMSEDRSSFHTIAISSSIIAALDLVGRCHVWDIHLTENNYMLKLPSARYYRIVASGRALAIACDQHESGKLDVVTWSAQTMMTRSFVLPLHPIQLSSLRDWNIMLNPKKESLFLFQIIRSKRYYLSISRRDLYVLYFTHTSLDGQICGQGQSEWLSNTYNATTNLDDDLIMTNTVEVNGTATLWLSKRLFPRPEPDYGFNHFYEVVIIRICFNFERTSFEIEERAFAGSGPHKHCIVHPLIWKEIMCWGDPSNTCTRLINFKESTCEQTKLASNLLLNYGEGDTGVASEPNFDPNEEEMCLGDETFLVHIDPSGCWKVWCFDKNIQMPNEDLGYRSLRMKNSQKHRLPGLT